MTRRQVIIAENLQHADRCATRQLKWRRVGTGRWTDDTGSEITYVGYPRQLLGYGDGTIVYLGWGWYKKWTPEFLDSRKFVLDEVTA